MSSAVDGNLWKRLLANEFWWVVVAFSLASLLAAQLSLRWNTVGWFVPLVGYCLLNGLITLYRTRWTFRFLEQVARVVLICGWAWYVSRQNEGMIYYCLGAITLLILAALFNRGSEVLARRYWPNFDILFREAAMGVSGLDRIWMRHVPVVQATSWWRDVETSCKPA